jgi:hypothetical protein
MRTCSTLVLGIIVGLAGRANGAPVTFTDEAAYLDAIALLGTPTLFEGFEDDAVWGDVRSTIVGGTHTASSVAANGITWTSNNTVSQVTTGPGAARTGNWGFFQLPHGDYANGIGDGFRLGASTELVGAGGWVETNTPFAEINLVLDGSTVLDFGDPTIGTVPLFFGVVETAGFRSIEFREIEGTIDDQKYIFADDFTIAGPALTGDYNQDGLMDAADYALWRKGLGTTYTQDDYDTWLAHFGQTAGSGAASAAVMPASGVPEPAPRVLLLLATASFVMFPRPAGSQHRLLK